MSDSFPDHPDDKFIAALIDENVELRQLVASLVQEIADSDPEGLDSFFDASGLGTDKIDHAISIWVAR